MKGEKCLYGLDVTANLNYYKKRPEAERKGMLEVTVHNNNAWNWTCCDKNKARQFPAFGKDARTAIDYISLAAQVSPFRVHSLDRDDRNSTIISEEFFIEAVGNVIAKMKF